MWQAVPGRQKDVSSYQGVLVLLFLLPNQNHPQISVGLFLPSVHHKNLPFPTRTRILSILLRFLIWDLLQHFPSHGFATPEPPATPAGRRPPALETQIQVTTVPKEYFRNYRLLKFNQIYSPGTGRIGTSGPSWTTAFPVFLHVGAAGQVRPKPQQQLLHKLHIYFWKETINTSIKAILMQCNVEAGLYLITHSN